MTRLKKISAIVSAILFLGTIIYQVNAYEGVVEDAVDPMIVANDEGEEIHEGEVYLPEESENHLSKENDESMEIASVPEHKAPGEDEAGLMEEVESEGDDGYIEINPMITTPPVVGLIFRDATTNIQKHPQIMVETLPTTNNQVGISIALDAVGLFGEETVLIGDIVPENWEMLSWSVIYNTNRTGTREFTYTERPFGDQLIHTMPEDICLNTDFWVMLPTFTVLLQPIPAVLSGTVTCVICPEGEPGLPMPGVTIRLYDDEGSFIRLEVTDEDGFFDFGQVPFGDYVLVKMVDTVPEGHLSIEPTSIELTIATPGGVYEEHFFVECKEDPTLEKAIIYINDEPLEELPEDFRVVEGDIVTYRLRVHNPNPRAWSDFLVVDVLPEGLILVGDVVVIPASALVEYVATDGGASVVIDLPAGPGYVDVILTARVDDVNQAVEGYFVNRAFLYGPPDEGGERPPIDDCEAEVPVEPPRISLVKAVSSETAEPGGVLTYTLIVRNTGGGTLTGVVVTDDLPVQLTEPRNLAIYPEGAGTGSFEGQLLTVNIPQLERDESVIITFDVTVAGDVENNTVIPNTANVTTDQNVYDEDEEEVTIEYVPPQLRPPGISIEKSVSSETVQAGRTLTYTLVVRNTGDDPLTNVVVTDNLPAQLTNPRNLVITPPGAGTGSFAGQLLTVNIPELEVDGSVVIVFDVTVAAGVANNTVIRNTAHVTTEEGPSADDDATTTVTDQPPGQAPVTGDEGILSGILFLFIVATTNLVIMFLLKAEKRKIHKK